MSFAIVAEFPLGVYRGRFGEGQLDLLPSPARLHCALIAAAGSGSRAVTARDGSLEPQPGDREALTWLELHPPDGLALPRRQTARCDARAYRDLGLLNPKKTGIRKVPKTDSAAVALGGDIMWIWQSEPPEPIRLAIEELCPDVAYLGQSDSPVRMWTVTGDRTQMTHRRDAEARLSSARVGDIEVDSPRTGRTEALTAAHAGRRPGKPPSLASDGARTNESELRPDSVTRGLGRDRYTAQSDPVAVPWTSCWMLPFTIRDHPTAQIAQSEKVAFAVALHRALVAAFNGDAPSVLTGNYGDSERGAGRLPPNRLALQIIEDNPALSPEARLGANSAGDGVMARQAFIVAVPADCDTNDLAAVAGAVALIKRVSARGRTLDILRPSGTPPAFIDASALWGPPQDGFCRVWNVLPAAVETRDQGKAWCLADAVALSIGLVWRDRLMGPEGANLRGERRYRYLVEQVRQRGVEILGAKALRETHVERYVHKMPRDLMPLPYTATVALGGLEPSGTAFVAIGQSRHLGGGLLIPCDVPPTVAESWRMK